VSSQTGVIASLNGGDLTLTAADGRNITVTEAVTSLLLKAEPALLQVLTVSL